MTGTTIIGPVATDYVRVASWVDESLSSLGATKIPGRTTRFDRADQILLMLRSQTGAWILGPDHVRASRHLARLLALRAGSATQWIGLKRDDLGDRVLVDAERIHPAGLREPRPLELPEEVAANYGQNQNGDYGTRRDFTYQAGGIARFLAQGMEGFNDPLNWGNASFEETLGVWTLPKKLPPWPRVKAARPKLSTEQKLDAAVAALDKARTQARIVGAINRLRKLREPPPLDPALLSKGLVHPDDDVRQWLLEQLERCYFPRLGPAGLASLKSRLRCCELESDGATSERCRSLISHLNREF